MKRTFALLLPVLLATNLVASAAGRQAAGNAAQSSTLNARESDVHQLANRVRKVIALIEDNATIPCETRNHFVQRLRLLSDTLEAGNRSGARALVIAWAGEARSYQQAGLLAAKNGSLLHNGLRGLPDTIGRGAPDKPTPTRKWKPLPVCDSGGTSGQATEGATATLVSGSYEPFDTNDILTLVRYFVGMVPEIGPLLSGIAAVLWPASGTDVSGLIDKALEEDTYTDAVTRLQGLRAALSPYDGFQKRLDAWTTDCAGKDTELCRSSAQNLYGAWGDVQTLFVSSRSAFQTDREDYQLTLLPVFAQYETLYLSFLREGMLLKPIWIASGQVTPSEAAIPGEILKDELNPEFINPDTNKKDRGIAYVDLVYARGLSGQPEPTNWNRWTARNGFVREMTLKVLDFRNTWQFFDPDVYGDGFEGGVKLTRMIYTDPLGHMPDADFDTDFKPPANVPGPLTELTVWAQRAPYNATRDGEWLEKGSSRAISAIQTTSPPTAGPAVSGRVTGDSDHDGADNRLWYRDLRVLGPITEVNARADRKSGFFRWIPSNIAVKLGATGTWDYLAWNDNVILSEMPQLWASYPGNVLAAAAAMGRYSLGNGLTSDAIIFGFRLYDSFLPSGALVSVASGKCMTLRTLSTGTQPVIDACVGGSGQIWSYNPNTKAVTIGEPDQCLETTGTTSGSAVVIDACTGAENEQWELIASATGLSGTIKAVESGLVLDLAAGQTGTGTPIVLSTAYGSSSQEWTATSPLRGEVHGVDSGRCLTPVAGGTTNGTPVEIADCNGTAAQAWTYDEAAHTLSINNGAKCLDAFTNAQGVPLAGLVRVWDCSGSSNQQWAFNRDGTIGLAPDNGLVLDVMGGSRANLSYVVTAARAGSSSQRWSRPSRRGGSVHATYAGKCLDLPNLDNGTQAQISDCLAPPAPGQEWTYHPLTRRLTVHGDGSEHCLSTSGTAVVVSACTADPNQLWMTKGRGVGGTLVNVASDLCMTLPGTGIVSASGTKVEVQACPGKNEPANPNQQWIWP